MFVLHLAPASALAALLAAPSAPLDRDPSRAERTAAAAAPAQAAAPARSTLGAAAPGAMLERARGGTDILNRNALGGAVSGNSASHVVSGSNVIQSGSFADMAGMPIVVQNSGANVLIQNATVIHLQLK